MLLDIFEIAEEAVKLGDLSYKDEKIISPKVKKVTNTYLKALIFKSLQENIESSEDFEKIATLSLIKKIKKLLIIGVIAKSISID
jgi:hypothetical protein